MTWSEFKTFLWKNLSDSKVFVDNIWCKFKCNSQYQSKSALDQALHLKYLQMILLKFDTDGVPWEPTMIKYFLKGLKLLIKAQIKQCGRKLDS